MLKRRLKILNKIRVTDWRKFSNRATQWKILKLLCRSNSFVTFQNIDENVLLIECDRISIFYLRRRVCPDVSILIILPFLSSEEATIIYFLSSRRMSLIFNEQL